MYQTCPTVKVTADNEQGFIVINEADFDEAIHEVFGAAPAEDGEDAPKRRGRPAKVKD